MMTSADADFASKNLPAEKIWRDGHDLVYMVKLRYEHRSVDGAGLDPLEKEPFSTFRAI